VNLMPACSAPTKTSLRVDIMNVVADDLGERSPMLPTIPACSHQEISLSARYGCQSFLYSTSSLSLRDQLIQIRLCRGAGVVMLVAVFPERNADIDGMGISLFSIIHPLDQCVPMSPSCSLSAAPNGSGLRSLKPRTVMKLIKGLAAD